jgi:hypothetical protein
MSELDVVQRLHDAVYDEVVDVTNLFNNGLITLNEFYAKLFMLDIPASIPGMIDRSTGLRHETEAEQNERLRKKLIDAIGRSQLERARRVLNQMIED